VAPRLTQTEILQKLGIPTTQQSINRIRGNGRYQQYINTQAGLHGLPAPFAPSTADAIIQDLLPIAGLAGGTALGSAADAGVGGAVAGDAASGAAGTGAGGIAGRALALGGLASLITSPLDFLKMIAWFFHPHNILRIVEGTIGLLFIWTGIWLMSKNLRNVSGGIGRSIAGVTPLGRGTRVIRKVRLPHAESAANGE